MIRAMAFRARYICTHALTFLCIFLILSLSSENAARAENYTPTGVWEHANKRIRVQILPCGETLCGKIVWFMWPNDSDGLPLVDFKNKNPAKRSRPLLGLTILWNLRHTGENTWTGGRIYNPDDGKYYMARMSIENDGTLRVRAYVIIPALGETLIWTRIR